MKTDRFLNEELQNIYNELKKHLNIKNGDPLFFHFDNLNTTELINFIICEKIFFFKSKYNDFSFLGIGHSKTIKSEDLAEHLSKNPKDFVIAAFHFETDPNASEFILPEWTFITKDGFTELIINPSFEYKSYSSPNLFFNLSNTLFDDFQLSPWTSYEEFPEHDQWEEMIKRCDLLFNKKTLEKIVLSRKKIFNYNEPIDPIIFFKTVLKKNSNADSSYAIFHQMTFDKAFISLTPEKLFSIYANLFESISLAASAPRGSTPSEDQIFEMQLNNNEKLIREHKLVTEEILKKIKPLSICITVSELQTMKLPYIQHRSIPIHAELLKNTSALELVNLLHPTPAIGGLPSGIAQMKILELEPYARKSYAAPIGIISHDFSELAVGIRSALIEGSKLTIFGGAGIVKGSIAEEEWIETGIKMNPFLKVVNHE